MQKSSENLLSENYLSENLLSETALSETSSALSLHLRIRDRALALGRARGRAECILEILSDYGPIPVGVQEKILTQTDSRLLERWFLLSRQVLSVDAFVNRMQGFCPSSTPNDNPAFAERHIPAVSRVSESLSASQSRTESR